MNVKLNLKDDESSTQGFSVFIVPEEYIHWGGFVGSFLLAIIGLYFFNTDGQEVSGKITPTGYIDLVLIFTALIACFRSVFLYIKAWTKSNITVTEEEDEDDDDNTGDTSGGMTPPSALA